MSDFEAKAQELKMLLERMRAQGGRGPENPMSGRELAQELGLESRKRVTDLVHYLREQGELIASGDNGYFYAHNEAEVIETLKQMQARIAGTQRAVSGMCRRLNRDGQMVML